MIDAPDAAFADPFVLMAEDWTPQGIFAFHPHRGIETVTFVIEGSIEHRDSAGYGGVIHAGDAQWMTAGRGIQHEENPPAGTVAHTLQLWVNLPAAEKKAVPRYQDLVASALPARSEDGVEIRVFSGAYGEMISPTLNHLPVTMFEVRVENGGAFRHSFAATDNAFVYVLEGAVEIGPAGDLLEASQLGWLTRSEEPGSSELTMTARGTAGRFLLFAGQPLREPIAFGGPFVMNTRRRKSSKRSPTTGPAASKDPNRFRGLQLSGGTELQVDSGDAELSPEDRTGCTGPHLLSTLSAPHVER